MRTMTIDVVDAADAADEVDADKRTYNHLSTTLEHHQLPHSNCN